MSGWTGEQRRRFGDLREICWSLLWFGLVCRVLVSIEACGANTWCRGCRGEFVDEMLNVTCSGFPDLGAEEPGEEFE